MDIQYRAEDGILEVRPTEALAEADFQAIAAKLNSILNTSQTLNGILVYTKDFPGYDKFSDMVAHGKFIKEQSHKVPKVALCTDSAIGNLLELIGKHLSQAEARHFAYDQRDEAETWLLGKN